MFPRESLSRTDKAVAADFQTLFLLYFSNIIGMVPLRCHTPSGTKTAYSVKASPVVNYSVFATCNKFVIGIAQK